MAIEALAIYSRHVEEQDEALRREVAAGTKPYAPRRFQISKTVDDSKRLNETAPPGIILAGSGMATGGRILHHFRRLLPDPKTTVLFVGSQAAGDSGRLPAAGGRAGPT